MTDKEIAKRLQIILLRCLKNEKSAKFFFRSIEILPVSGPRCCP